MKREVERLPGLGETIRTKDTGEVFEVYEVNVLQNYVATAKNGMKYKFGFGTYEIIEREDM